jgi:hypothetical protein
VGAGDSGTHPRAGAASLGRAQSHAAGAAASKGGAALAVGGGISEEGRALSGVIGGGREWCSGDEGHACSNAFQTRGDRGRMRKVGYELVIFIFIL